MLQTFEDDAAFLEAVGARISHDGLPPEITRARVDGVGAADIALRAEPSADTDLLNLRVGSWFIRDDDAPFFESLGTIGTILATIATTGGVALPIVVAAAATLAA